MHILIAHNEYGKFSGEERAVKTYEKLLLDAGHEVSWYTRSSAEIGDSVLQRMKAAASGVNNPYARREMISRLDSSRPDAVLVQNLYPFLSPSILGPCRERGVPVVMRCPNYRLFCPNGLHMTRGAVCEKCLGPGREAWCVLKNCEQSLFKSTGYALRNAVARMGHRIIGNVNVFIVLSEFQKARFIRNGISEDRLVVVPNCTEMPKGPVHTGQTISFFGRVAPEKGIAEFLDIARALPELPFAVAGEVRDSACALVDAAPGNVVFHGHLEGGAQSTFLRNTRILVLCSNWFEGFPNAAIEGMAYAKPVVATRIGGIPEIVDDGVTGLLYSPGDAGTAAEHIATLFADAQRCQSMGEAGREKVMRAYSEETVRDKVHEAFRCAEAFAAEERLCHAS